MVIAPNGYQDIEYGDTRTVLEKKGHEIEVASTTAVAQGALGGSVETDLMLGEANPGNYDAIVFIGGPGTSLYFQNPKALELAKTFYGSGKVTAAICIAPVILANAGILEGKHATVFPSGAEELVRKGAKFTDSKVEIDGNIVTANGPNAAAKFGKKIAKLL